LVENVPDNATDHDDSSSFTSNQETPPEDNIDEQLEVNEEANFRGELTSIYF
jgi:hypothetical protein